MYKTLDYEKLCFYEEELEKRREELLRLREILAKELKSLRICEFLNYGIIGLNEAQRELLRMKEEYTDDLSPF